jgi:TP901 family phage tail tape measure protein
MDMGTAIWRGVAEFSSLFKGQKQAAAGFDELGRKSDSAGAKGTSFGDKMTTSLNKVGPKMKSTGQSMSVGLTLPIVALGVKAVQSFSNFESSITAAGAKTEATGAQIEQMKQVALDMGAKTKFSAGEAATAMDNMAAAGFSANGVMQALPGVMLAAQASGEDLGMTADITAKAINAFGLAAGDATHVADVFATAANTSAIDMHGLGESLAQAGQLGASANQDLEDVVAVLGRLVDMGVPAASAGAGIRQAVQSLQAPTAKASGFINDLGLKLRDATGKMLPLPDLLKNIEVGLSSANPEFVAQAKAAHMTQTAYADWVKSALFGVEGSKAVTLALAAGKPVLLDTTTDTAKLAQLQAGLAKTMGGPAAKAWIAAHTNMGKFSASGADAVRALGALNRASDGTSKKIGDMMSNTTKARLDQLGGSFETLGITLVTIVAPALTKIVTGLTDAVNAFAKWAKAHPTLAKIVIVIAAVLAILGPLLIGLGLIAGAITAITAVGAPVILIIIAVIAAIAALILIGVYLIKHWGSIKKFLIGVWNAIKGAAISVWNAIGSFFSGIWAWLVNLVKTVWGGIASFFTGLWNGILAVASAVWNAIVAAVMVPVNLVVGLVKGVFNGLMAFWRGFWGIFGGLITAVWNLIVAIVRLGVTLVVQTVSNILRGLLVVVRAIWGAITAATSAAWGVIKAVVLAVAHALAAGLSAAWNAIKVAASAVWNVIKAAAGAVWKAIQAVIIAPIRALWGLLSGPINTVKNALAAAWTAVKNGASAWNALVTLISGIVGRIGTAVSGVKDKIVGVFKGAGSWLLNAGKQIIQGLIDGITGMINKVTDKLKEITDKIPDWKGPAPVDRKLLFRSGLMIMGGLARGIQAGVRGVKKTLGGVTMSIAPSFDNVVGLPPGARPPGAPPAAGGMSAAPPVHRDEPGGGGNTYNITAINPVGETTAETTSKAVTRLAVLGVAS